MKNCKHIFEEFCEQFPVNIGNKLFRDFRHKFPRNSTGNMLRNGTLNSFRSSSCVQDATIEFFISHSSMSFSQKLIAEFKSKVLLMSCHKLLSRVRPWKENVPLGPTYWYLKTLLCLNSTNISSRGLSLENLFGAFAEIAPNDYEIFLRTLACISTTSEITNHDMSSGDFLFFFLLAKEL